MARVSMRVGWGRTSALLLAIAGLNAALGALLVDADHPGVAALVFGFAALATGFALVHPDRVLATDDDDDPRVQVGDRVDD